MMQENEVMLVAGAGCNEPDVLGVRILLDWTKTKNMEKKKTKKIPSQILIMLKKCVINKQTKEDSQHYQICHCSMFTPVGQKNPDTDADILQVYQVLLANL